MKQVWAKFRGQPAWLQAVVGAAAVLIVIGAAAGPEDEDEQPVSAGQVATTVAQVQTTIAPTTPTPTVRPTVPPTVAATVAPTTVPAGPKTTFGAGTHRVGVDIAPGTYVAPGGSSCYWERQAVFGGGDLGDIIANEFAPGQGQVVVTIEASDKGFKTSGCGTWTRG